MDGSLATFLGIDASLGEAALAAATLVGALGALLAIFGAARNWYRRTLGRRRDRYERLQRLGNGARILFFESVLGEPAAMRRTFEAQVSKYDGDGEMSKMEREFSEHIFIDRDYYVQALCDTDETVLAFSVTTRSKRFRPRFRFPPKPSWRRRRVLKRESGQAFEHLYDVRLGRTRFLDLGRPGRFRASVGARPWSFTELHGFGNPGGYQEFAFTASSATGVGAPGPIVDLVSAVGHDWTSVAEDDEIDLLTEYRAKVLVTTFTIIGPRIFRDDYPLTFGPHGDEVRTIP